MNVAHVFQGYRDPEEAAKLLAEALSEPWRTMDSVPKQSAPVDLLCDSVYSPYAERLTNCDWSDEENDWMHTSIQGRESLTKLQRKPLLWRRCLENKIRLR